MIIRSTGRAVSLVAAAAFIAVAAAPASADPTNEKSKQDEVRAPAVEKKGETRYCVVDKITGSLLPHKVCKTRKEWIQETGQDPVKS